MDNTQLELWLNRLLIFILIIVFFFLGRYSIFLDQEITFPYEVVVDYDVNDDIQNMLDQISRYDVIQIANDLSRLEKSN